MEEDSQSPEDDLAGNPSVTVGKKGPFAQPFSFSPQPPVAQKTPHKVPTWSSPHRKKYPESHTPTATKSVTLLFSPTPARTHNAYPDKEDNDFVESTQLLHDEEADWEDLERDLEAQDVSVAPKGREIPHDSAESPNSGTEHQQVRSQKKPAATPSPFLFGKLRAPIIAALPSPVLPPSSSSVNQEKEVKEVGNFL